MPRVSEAEKQRSHSRILDSAAEVVRERGVEAASLGDIMKAAGMTHGGFYRHFANKEGLVAAAIDRAADDVLSSYEVRRANGDEEAAVDYINEYLSDRHRLALKSGCPLAAVAGEALRADGLVRTATQNAARRTARLLSGPSNAEVSGDEADDLGLATLSVLVGTIVLSRLARDEGEAQCLLKAGARTINALRDPSDDSEKETMYHA